MGNGLDVPGVRFSVKHLQGNSAASFPDRAVTSVSPTILSLKAAASFSSSRKEQSRDEGETLVPPGRASKLGAPRALRKPMDMTTRLWSDPGKTTRGSETEASKAALSQLLGSQMESMRDGCPLVRCNVGPCTLGCLARKASIMPDSLM